MLRKTVCALLLVAVVSFCGSEAFADAKSVYDKALDKFYAAARGELDAREALDALLPTYETKLSAYDKAHCAMYIGDLYYRLDDYDQCKEWELKVIENKELYYTSVVNGDGQETYKHGLAAVVLLANAAAANGKPEDIEKLESGLSVKELATRVYVKYCWSNQPENMLYTILRFYEALAYKNAGNTEKMREIIEMSSFKTGEIRVGNTVMPIQDAAVRVLF
jgi:tetratricopeptide (TPR) repeat protein